MQVTQVVSKRDRCDHISDIRRKMKRKILFLERSSLSGGSYGSLRGLVEDLDTERYSCHLVSYRDPAEGSHETFFDSVTLLPRGVFLTYRWCIALRVRLRRFSSRFGWPHAIFDRAAIRVFRDALDSLKPDLVYGNIDPVNEAIFFREAIGRGVPVISHIRHLPQKTTSRGLVRFLNNSVSLFISNSAFAKQAWVLNGLREGRHKIIWNGVRCENSNSKRTRGQRETVRGNTLRFVCCGRLVPLKRWSLVLEALAHLARRRGRLSFECTIIGDGPDRNYLESLAATLELEEIVKFAGHQADLVDRLPTFDCMLHACTQETFGRVIIEAMHAGVIVVACGVGGVAEIIEDGKTGYLSGGDTVQDYIRAIDRCLSERAKWPALIEAAKMKANRDFSLKKQTQRIAEELENVLVERRERNNQISRIKI